MTATSGSATGKAAPVVPAPVLRVTAGGLTGTVFRLAADRATLGRRPANTYVLADPTVSRRHARVSRRAGAVIITDLDSTGGTQVNGGRLNPSAVLHHGDELRFGSVPVVFEDPRELTRDEQTTDSFQAPGAGTGPPARQQQVLALIAEGLTNQQIGAALGISEYTVKDHVRELYERLGVSNRAGAVGRAAARGWIDGLDPETL